MKIPTHPLACRALLILINGRKAIRCAWGALRARFGARYLLTVTYQWPGKKPRRFRRYVSGITHLELGAKSPYGYLVAQEWERL